MMVKWRAFMMEASRRRSPAVLPSGDGLRRRGVSATAGIEAATGATGGAAMQRALIRRWVDIFRTADQHLYELVRGTVIAFALRGVAAGSEFAFTVLLGRILGADGAGVYFLAFTVALIGTVVGRLGLDNALVRHVASNAAAADWDAVKGVTRWGQALGVGASLAVSLVIVSLGPWFADEVLGKPEVGRPVQWMALAVVPWAMTRLYGEMLRGLRQIFLYQLFHSVGYRVLALAAVIALAPPFGMDGAVLGFVASTAIMAVTGCATWYRMTPQLRNVRAAFDPLILLRTSLPLFWVQPAALAMTWIPTFVLGHFATTADVGVFSAAARTALLSILVLIAVNAIAAPKFAAFWRNGNRDGLARMTRQSMRLLMLLSIPAFALFFLVPEWIMGLFGPEFREAGGSILFIIAIGQFVNVITGSIGPLLIMSGHEKIMRDNMLLGAGVNFALSIALIPDFGATGAAIATATSLAVSNLAGAYAVWTRLGILTIPLPIKAISRLMRGLS